MRGNYSCRNIATALAVAAMAFAVPMQTFAGQSYTATVKPTKERGPKDKITTTCVPGTADYDIDQCYEDIKD
jgi:hypothetical protein